MKKQRKKNPIYYWETETRHGQFRAKNDEEALKKMPQSCWVLYRENEESPDINDFVVLYDYKGKKEQK